MLTNEQLAMRQTGLGASEIAAALGEHPDMTPLDVWCRKTGRSLPFSEEQEARMAMGHVVEQEIARRTARKRRFLALEQGTTRVHPLCPVVLATPDFLATPETLAALVAVECKNVGWGTMRRWSDGLPDYVDIQVQIQLEVYDLENGVVGAWLGGRDPVDFDVRRDRAYAASLMEVAADWWRKHVLADVPPDPDGTERYAEYLYTRHPRALGTVRDANPDEERLLYALRSTQARRKQAEEDEARVKQELMARIGDDRGIAGAAGRVVWSEIAPCAVPATTRKAHRKLMPRWNEED